MLDISAPVTESKFDIGTNIIREIGRDTPKNKCHPFNHFFCKILDISKHKKIKL
jgi:hypothetical protein